MIITERGFRGKWLPEVPTEKTNFSLLARRLVFYLKNKKIVIIYLLTILIVIFLMYRFPFATDLENYKSISSTIFQGLASILAIVITLTLLSVQIFSQNYSTRILKIFIGKKNYALWFLMMIYSVSIIFNLLAPYYVPPVTSSLIIIENISVWLTIISLLFLFPYLVYTIQILQPQEVLKIISDQINEDLILKIVEYSKIPYVAANFTDLRELPSQTDPLIPFIEIIVEAIKDNRSSTAEESLVALGNIFFDLEHNNIINEKNGKPVLYYFLERIEVVRDVAVNSGDFRTFNKLTEITFRIGFSISKKINNYTPLIMFFEDTSESCTQRDFELVRLHLISDFQTLFNELIKAYKIDINPFYNIYSMDYPNLDELIRIYKRNKEVSHIHNIYSIINYLNRFWISSIENRLSNTKQSVLMAIQHIIIQLVKESLFGLIKHETFFLMQIGTIMIEENPELLDEVLFNLKLTSDELFREWILNIKTPKKKVSSINNMIINVIEAIKFIGYESLNKEKYDLKIGDYYNEDEIILLENTIILAVINSLNQIALKYVDEKVYESKLSEEEIYDVLIRIINYESTFGTDLSRKKSDSVIDVINSIYSIAEGSTKSPRHIKFKIGMEIFYGLRKIADETITFDSRNVSDCARSLKKLMDWAIDNDFDLLKSLILDYLGEIGLKLSDRGILTDELKNLVKIFEKITLKNINKQNEFDTKNSLKQIKVLAEDMANKKFDESEIKMVFDPPLSDIRKLLLTEGMHDVLTDLQEWIKRYQYFYSNL